jgi:hypothetical protein
MTNDIVARLREEGFITHMARLPRESKILHAAADEIERLREQRDEARREILESLHPDLRKGYAAARGWNCFDKNKGSSGDECQREAL